MAGVPLSQVVFNAREEDVSSDLDRAQSLLSRDVQNIHGGMSGSIDAADPQHAAGLLTANGAPITGANSLATLNPVAASFNMTLGPGDAFVQDATGIGADDSAYKALRWPQQVVTFGAPAGQPRIDIVVATPATVLADSASRNILVDPVARTVTSASVFKTMNPTATIAVVAGTASATPVPPATPTGAVVLFYVYVPNGATAASGFFWQRGLWRRATFPWTCMGGVISGMNLLWDLSVDATVANSSLAISGVHRVVIDGEVLEFEAACSTANGGVIQDTGANPFGTSAPSTHDRPYYIYAVGGRHNPYLVRTGSQLSPIVLVESLVAPDIATGKPQGTLVTAQFPTVTNGATYVGLGFTVANSIRRRACVMDGSMTHVPAATENVGGVTLTGGGFVDAVSTLSAPSISTRARGQMILTAGAGVGLHNATMVNDRGDGGGAITNTTLAGLMLAEATASQTGGVAGSWNWPEGSPAKFWLNGTAGDVVNVIPTGFNHRVNRFDGCAGA